MKRILKAITGNDPLHYIVVAQYRRSHYDIGDEDKFHWAILIIKDLEKPTEVDWPCYQAVNKVDPETATEVWSIDTRQTAMLGKTSMWRGGVIVGHVKESELKDLDKVFRGNLPVVKAEGHRCRDWVVEGIELMAERGWIPTEIHSKERLMPTMRVVCAVSKERYLKREGPVIYELDQGVEM